MKGFVKDPDATLDYSIDWSPWLDGDLITASDWVAEAGLTIVPGSKTYTDTVTTVYVSGGTAGQEYELTNTISTQGSRTDERTITIRFRNR